MNGHLAHSGEQDGKAALTGVYAPRRPYSGHLWPRECIIGDFRFWPERKKMSKGAHLLPSHHITQKPV
jgi:hypothetical protein